MKVKGWLTVQDKVMTRKKSFGVDALKNDEDAKEI